MRSARGLRVSGTPRSTNQVVERFGVGKLGVLVARVKLGVERDAKKRLSAGCGLMLRINDVFAESCECDGVVLSCGQAEFFRACEF